MKVENQEQAKRLEQVAPEIAGTQVPEKTMALLRARFGLAAEHYAQILAMSDTEFRLMVADKLQVLGGLADKTESGMDELAGRFVNHSHRFGGEVRNWTPGKPL